MSSSEVGIPHEQVLATGRLWPRFLLFPTMAVCGYAGLVNHWGSSAWWAQSLWVLFLTFCWFCVAAVFHECAHQNLGANRRANIWGGRIIGTILAIPYTAFRETHMLHHAHLNTPRDCELWPYADPGASLTFRRLFVWFDIVGGVIAAPIIFSRIVWARNSPLNPKHRRTILKEYLAVALFWGGIFFGTFWLHVQGMIDLTRFDPVWLLPVLLSPMLNTVRKLSEHLGMASYDPILGTRTIIPGNFVTRLCSYFDFELCVHGPHHRHPKLSCDRLAPYMRGYLADHRQSPVPLFSSYRAAVLDVWPYLFRNPGVGVNAGGSFDFDA
jgi:fatty acid desaturase